MTGKIAKLGVSSRNRIAGFACMLVFGLALGACEFSDLREDLEKLEERAHEYQGRILSPSANASGLVVVALADLDGRDLSAFRVVANPGPYRLFSESNKVYLFAFEDRNLDFRFEEGERYGWAMDGGIVDVSEQGEEGIDITVASDMGPPPPKFLLNRPLIDKLYGNHDFHFGTITAPDHEMFSLKQAKKGMWQPYSFIEDGGTGIHFLEAYDHQRVPVLFVHGLLGSPVNFEPLIAQLDRERYQAWYVSYPSGFDMHTISGGLLQFMEIVHRRHQFETLHLVAHSMGGLAARGALNLCQAGKGCNYVKSLTSISTPWNGVESASSGATWAPTVVPVWRDLAPDSEYVQTLFDTPLPPDLPFNLLFGYRVDSLFPNESSDGVIGLSSQLREAAQREAQVLRGYNEGHVSILGNAEVGALLNDLLDR